MLRVKDYLSERKLVLAGYVDIYRKAGDVPIQFYTEAEMAKIYIASPIRLEDINQSIATELREKLVLDVFLPISLYMDPEEPGNSLRIGRACYDEMDQSDIFIVVVPFGLSVAAEIGYIVQKKRLGYNKYIIMYLSGLGDAKPECMIDYFVDYKVNTIDSLINIVRILI